MCALLVVLVEWSCSGGRAASRTETRSISVAGAGASSPPSLLFAQVAVVLKSRLPDSRSARSSRAAQAEPPSRSPGGSAVASE